LNRRKHELYNICYLGGRILTDVSDWWGSAVEVLAYRSYSPKFQNQNHGKSFETCLYSVAPIHMLYGLKQTKTKLPNYTLEDDHKANGHEICAS
jgi:hypothetical protein